MALAKRRTDRRIDYWPGFVDALSTLVLSIIFLLTVFMVAQFFLSQQITGKDTALARLTAQISRLSELLSLERTGKTSLEAEIAQLRASLSAVEGERDRMRGAAEGAQSSKDAGKAEVGKLNSQIDIEKAATARAVAQIEILNQQISALRRQIAALESALDVTEKKEKDAQLRWKEFGYWLIFPIALLGALWFRKGSVVRWVPVLLVSLVAFQAQPLRAEEHRAAQFEASAERFVLGLFLTGDQQGRWHFERGDYVTAAQRFTDPDRTSPAAKIPGRLVSSGVGRRLFSRHAGASATPAPVLTNPLSSRSISAGNHSVHGRAPTMEKTAGVRTTRRSPVLVFSSSICSSFFPPDILRISVL